MTYALYAIRQRCMSRRDLFPFSLAWKRHRMLFGDWYTSEWPLLSKWCDSTFGFGNWEYIEERFRFKTEEDFMLFTMRWL